MTSMFKAVLREVPGAIAGAITGAAQKAGDLMGQAMVIPTKMAFEAVISEMKDVFNAFNPGLQLVKAFNEFNKIQERMAAVNLSRDKLLEKARGDELKTLKGSFVETSKSMATNFEAGLKPNNAQLLKLQEVMRFTGQRTESLMKSMVNLSYSTGGSQVAINELIRASNRLREEYGISSEKLFDAISKLDKESQDLAALYGESPMLAKIGESLTAMTGGQIPQDQLNAILRLFYINDEQNYILRNMLGIEEGFLQNLEGLQPEQREAALLAEVKRAFNVLQNNFANTGSRMVDTAIRNDLKFGQIQIALSNLSKIDLDERKQLAKDLKDRSVGEEANKTMVATLEAEIDDIQRKMAEGDTLVAFRDSMISIAKSLNALPNQIAESLLPLKQAFTRPGGGQNSEAFQTPASKQGQANFKAATEAELLKLSSETFRDESWWDTTDDQVEAFVKSFGKAGNRLNDNIQILDLLNKRAQEVADKAMSVRDSWTGWAPYEDEVVPTQIETSYRQLLLDTIDQLQSNANKLPEAIRETYLEQSLKALEDVDIRDLLDAFKNQSISRFQALLTANNTEAQLQAIKARSDLLESEYKNLMTQAQKAKTEDNRKETERLEEKLREIAEVIREENLIRRNFNLQVIDLGQIPGVGVF